jgi:hypothetical protein
MKNSALIQAADRLRRAENAAQALASAQSYQQAEDAWSTFLLNANAIYSKLEQGAKGHGSSEAWFGRMKRERKKDPLLSYLHFARNSDEHGILRVTETVPGSATQLIKPGFGERHMITLTPADRFGNPTGEPVPGIMCGPRLKCVAAHDDRYGDFRDPPETHRGERIVCPRSGVAGGDYPDILADLAVGYLSQLVADARALQSA